MTNPLPPAQRTRWVGIGVGILALVAVVLVTGLVDAGNLARVMAGVAIAASVAYFALLLTSAKVTPTERSRVRSFIPLYLASVGFWALFQQQATVVAIYAQESLDRTILGWTMPASFVQSINPVFIIVFAGVFATVWTKLGPRQPSSPLKFAAGLAVMGLAFLAFIPFSGGGPGSTPLLALVGILLLFTFAELFLSPIGLSVATKLAPEAFRTQMVALFFLSVSVGTTLAGILAGYYSSDGEVGYFSFIGITAIVLGVALAVATPAVKRLMAGVR